MIAPSAAIVIPPPDVPHSPALLGDVLIETRQRERENVRTHGQITEDGLKELLRLAYFAGLQSDEGRYPRLRLYVPSRVNEVRKLVVRFTPPVKLTDPAVICRLAPTLPSEDHALLIQERGEALFCEGLLSLLEEDGMEVIGSPNLEPRSGRHGLMIRIIAPGEISTAENRAMLRLRAGRISMERAIREVEPVRLWLRETADKIVRRCRLDDPDFDILNIEENAWQKLGAIWSQVLLTARALRHGAAFAILPEPPTAWVHLRYATESFSLSERLERFFLACAGAVRLQDQPGFAHVASEWRYSKQGLLSAARVLGNLSAADGCVLLDRSLRLTGFAGIIAVDSQNKARRFAAWGSSLPRRETELDRFGMRHRSAFHLCQAVAKALVFVVSQDGDLRVFHSDNERVYLEEGLSPEWF